MKRDDDEPILVSAGEDGLIKVWSIAKRKCGKTIQGHSRTITDLIQFQNPDNQNLIIISTSDNFIKLLDIHTKECLMNFEAHEGYITSLIQLHGNDNFSYVISASEDSLLKLWDFSLPEAKLIKSIDHVYPAYIITFINRENDSNTFATAGAGVVKLWNCFPGNYVCTLTSLEEGDLIISMKHITWTKNDTTLVCSSKNGEVIFLNLCTYECFHRFKAGCSEVTRLIAPKLYREHGRNILVLCSQKMQLYDVDNQRVEESFFEESCSNYLHLEHSTNEFVTYNSYSHTGTVSFWKMLNVNANYGLILYLLKFKFPKVYKKKAIVCSMILPLKPRKTLSGQFSIGRDSIKQVSYIDWKRNTSTYGILGWKDIKIMDIETKTQISSINQPHTLSIAYVKGQNNENCLLTIMKNSLNYLNFLSGEIYYTVVIRSTLYTRFVPISTMLNDIYAYICSYSIRLCNINSQESIANIQCMGRVTCVVQLYDGKSDSSIKLAFGNDQGGISFWNDSHKITEVVKTNHQHVTSLAAVYRSGEEFPNLMSSGIDNTLNVWNIKQYVCIASYKIGVSFVQLTINYADRNLIGFCGQKEGQMIFVKLKI